MAERRAAGSTTGPRLRRRERPHRRLHRAFRTRGAVPVSLDPDRRGREVAAIFLEHSPRLFEDLVASDVWARSGADAGVMEHARHEWEAFALYACVRGLVAGGGFNRETAAAIDALHETVALQWRAESRDEAAVRAHVSERYTEYGEIGQAGGASGAESVTLRLGAAAARHMTGAEPGDDRVELSELAGALHESLAESVTEHLRRG